MAGYVGNIPVPQGTQTRQTFTATASQTSFPTLGYTAGFIDVYLNGVKLLDTVDYAATNGSDVVLTTGAALNDILEVTIFDTFTTAGTSFTNPTFIDTATISGDTTATVTLKNNTEEDTDGGRESTIIFQGEQSGGEISTLAEIEASHDGTADDEKGDLIFRTNDGSDGASPTERIKINNTEVVINDNSNDLDFRVESDDSTHAFNVDGQHSTVGINTAAVSNRTLKIEAEGNVGAGISLNESNRGGYVEFSAGSGTELYVGSEKAILGSGSNDEFTIYVGQQAIKVNRNGQVTLPQMPAFAATRSQGHVAANTDYIYANVYFNRGNDYNNSNGRFTAPIAGIYAVHVNHMDISTAIHTNTYYDIRKNGATYQLVYGSNPTSGAHHRWSWSGIVEMAANDYLNIYTGNMGLYGNANEYTNFSAALLG